MIVFKIEISIIFCMKILNDGIVLCWFIVFGFEFVFKGKEMKRIFLIGDKWVIVFVRIEEIGVVW